MCLEDYRLGRKIYGGVSVAVLSVTSAQIISPSPTRVFLIFCPPSSGTVTLLPSVSVVAGSGIQLPSTGNNLVLNIKDVGDIVTKSWSAIASAGTPSFAIIEGFLLEQ